MSARPCQHAKASILARHDRCCRARLLLFPRGRKHRGGGFGSTYVALEGALENKLLSHIEFFVEMGSTKRRSGGLGG